MRNIAKVYVSPELITGMLTKGHECGPATCAEGLPEGATLIGARLSFNGDVELRFEHESFPAVAEGADPEMIINPIYIAGHK